MISDANLPGKRLEVNKHLHIVIIGLKKLQESIISKNKKICNHKRKLKIVTQDDKFCRLSSADACIDEQGEDSYVLEGKHFFSHVIRSKVSR